MAPFGGETLSLTKLVSHAQLALYRDVVQEEGPYKNAGVHRLDVINSVGKANYSAARRTRPTRNKQYRREAILVPSHDDEANDSGQQGQDHGEAE
jgi:hypothetical protein